MPHYEFDCLGCGCSTTYLLHDNQELDPKRAACEWCKSKSIRMTSYFKSADLVIHSLQEHIRGMEFRINDLENPGLCDEDYSDDLPDKPN